MAEHTVNIDVIDISIPEGNHRNIPIINKPNRCYGYAANAKEVAQLIQLSRYYVYEAGTNKIINGDNYYDYFPEEGGGGGGGVTPEEVQAMITASIDTSIDTESNNAIANSTITNFVNSSISTATADFKGTFTSLEDLEATEANNNDYAFLQTTDTSGNTIYKKYKYTDSDGWVFEYELNNSSFTAEQWAAINSGVKSSDVTQIGTNSVNIAKLQADLSKVGSTFRGIFNTQEAMDAAVADKNDTAILQSTDANGNTIYTMESYVSIEPSGEIPSGYTQLLYIESTGTQYIDTGVNPNSYRRIYIKFNPLSYVYDVSFFGLVGFSDRGFTDTYQLRTDNGSSRFFLNGTSFTASFDFPGINEFEYNYPSLTINGTSSTISDPGEWSYSDDSNIYLFAYRYQTGGTPAPMGYSSMRLYGCKIYDDDQVTIVRDFVPVRNSNNEVGLYDVVNGQFYGNLGTGSFTAGPAADGYWIVNYSFANNVLTSAQIAALASGITSANVSQIGTNTSDISNIKTDVNNLNKDMGDVASVLDYVLYGKAAFTRTIDFTTNDMSTDGVISLVRTFSNMRRCNVADDGTINAFYGDAGYTEDGTNGQVMVYVPKFWYKTTPITLVNNLIIRKASYSISNAPETGYKLHPAFYDGSGNEIDYFLIGAFEASFQNGSSYTDAYNASYKMASVKGNGSLYPSVSFTRANGRTTAQARGTGWYQAGFKQISAIQMLFTVEYGCNSQVAVGNGISSGSKTYVGKTTGNSTSGTTANSKTAVSYRGIENLWGNAWNWIDGLNIIADRKPYVCSNFSFVDDTSSGYEYIGWTVPTSNNYVTGFGYNSTYDWLFLPAEVGSSTPAIADYFYQNTGNRIARLGGAWNLGSNAGLFCWILGNDSSNSSTYIGSRLMFIPN